MHRRCIRTLNLELGHRRSWALSVPCRQKHSGIDSSLSDEEHALALKITQQLVDRAAAGPGNGWTPLKTLRGERDRLVNSIDKKGQLGRLPSKQKNRFIAAASDSEPKRDVEGMMLVSTSGPVAAPGTFIELRKNDTIVMNGLVLGEKGSEYQSFVIALVSTGEIWIVDQEDIVFAVPGLVSRHLAERCGNTEIAQNEKEVMARVEVLRRIRDTEKEVERAFHLVGQTFHTIYPRARPADSEQWSRITVAQVMELLKPAVKPSFVTTFAVHKHLMNHDRHFVADHASSYRTSQCFDVRPQSHVNVIERVTAMSRMTNGPIDAFAERVRRITDSTQKRDLESWNEGSSLEQVDASIFNADDVTIINFLRYSMRARPSYQSFPYHLGMAAIIKKLDRFTGVVDTSVAFQVLKDIGVVPPWQDLISYSHEYPPRRGPDPESAISQVAISDSPVGKAKTLKTVHRPVDHSEGINRHDFGDMPVYVVDDITASELDDGISVEPISSEPDSAWVHVHIADPTAVIHPNSELSRLARERSTSIYFLHATHSMLPPSVVYEGLSLGSSRERNHNVLTFSYKINLQGDIADYKVRPGLVNNIQRLDYDGVDRVMGVNPPEAVYPFGKPLSAVSARSLHIDQRHLHNIRLLHDMSDRLVQARLRTPTFMQGPTHLSISLPSGIPPIPPIDLRKTTLYRGFPEIIYRSISMKSMDYGSRRMISELMKASCRVASRFCLDHGILVLRRTSPRLVTQSESDFEELLSMRDSDGYVDYIAPLRMGAKTPPAEYMLQPRMHWSLGIPEGEGYVRVTSPLRRYSDLVAHWQIKHAFLSSQGRPPFSEEYLQEYAKYAVTMERTSKQITQGHEKYWALMFIQRWMQDRTMKNEDHGHLENLSAVAINAPELNNRSKGWECLVRIPSLGFNAMAVGFNAQCDISPGMEIRVRVDSILLGSRPQMTVVVR